MTTAGFPHSDIHGSILACSSPWLFAAYRVLRRLMAPRHPPYALSSLTFQLPGILLVFLVSRFCFSMFAHFRGPAIFMTGCQPVSSSGWTFCFLLYDSFQGTLASSFRRQLRQNFVSLARRTLSTPSLRSLVLSRCHPKILCDY